jgi:polyketide biosynthesis enoyl-CoA hydratase PksH
MSQYETLRVRHDDNICVAQLYRPTARNAINARMIAEFATLLAACESSDVSVIVLEGLPDVFCFGADFNSVSDHAMAGRSDESSAAALYDIWTKLASGPFVTIAHVRGAVNAGGNGFVAACDIAIADSSASFSLSELLFGLYPACVMPFLVRRIGLQRANYMAISTQPIAAQEACEWGLVDRIGDSGEAELQRHLRRLRRLSRDSIASYKRYLSSLPCLIESARAAAIENNRSMHTLPGVIEGIVRYAQNGQFPWEDR